MLVCNICDFLFFVDKKINLRAVVEHIQFLRKGI